MPNSNTPQHLFLPQRGHYRQLRVYHVTEALYDLTYLFCRRFLPPHGDRTVDQMVQAARSGKQNIAEGNQAATTSSETEIKLTNVARASIEELLADYEDYLRTRSLPQWDRHHPRFEPLRRWASSNTFLLEYTPKAASMTDEELANLCITLCHQTIYMLGRLLRTQQERFVTQGGIREQMTAARLGYRTEQRSQIEALQQENAALREKVAQLEALVKTLQGKN
ncbi:MAG: four helix bundle suffix domain-containing protein [Bacteroidales bacterium]|nr:four helix bundle suffix domain-containing protein [Bacteroidales bacterium]